MTEQAIKDQVNKLFKTKEFEHDTNYPFKYWGEVFDERYYFPKSDISIFLARKFKIRIFSPDVYTAIVSYVGKGKLTPFNYSTSALIKPTEFYTSDLLELKFGANETVSKVITEIENKKEKELAVRVKVAYKHKVERFLGVFDASRSSSGSND